MNFERQHPRSESRVGPKLIANRAALNRNPTKVSTALMRQALHAPADCRGCLAILVSKPRLD
jgi:hypothetical protein